jgi:cytochrome oxidase Cu insertion factor (SCO1/SenC/PrrC family)
MNNPVSSATPSPLNMEQQRRARLIMLGIVAVFVLPFFVLPLITSPERVGKNNKGLLIQPHIPFADLGLVNERHQPMAIVDLGARWTLLYVIPANCDAACVSARNNALYAMRQVRLSLDRDVDRVQQLVVFTAEPDGDLDLLMQQQFANMKRVEGNQQTLEAVLYARLPVKNPAGSMFLMSPDGYVFMAYPTFVDEKESILRARDIRTDLKKSIKGERQF